LDKYFTTTAMSPIKSYRDLEVYDLAHDLAMEIFSITLTFPSNEKYSLIDQIRRSSRSVSVNICEGWGKRHYKQQFKKYLIDSLGSLEETTEWIRFSFDCNYLDLDNKNLLLRKYHELGAKIYKLHENWK